MNNKHQYWLVGATWGNDDEKYHDFIANGYWESGYAKGDKPEQDQRIDQMKEGDRIAIKRSLGSGDSDILIRSIGVITEIDRFTRRVYVRWLVRGTSRKVSSKGAYGTIHGPYLFDGDDNNWVANIFSI